MASVDLTPLVIRAQAGDTQALSDLMGQCYETLYYYAYKTVNDRDLAGDITQESCIEIMETLGKLREPAAFRTWAGRIVYHQCTRYFKQTKPVLLEEDEEGETLLDRLPDESRGSVPELVQEDKEFQKTVMAMVNGLPAEQRSAMMLYYYENLSVGQIAQIQAVSEGTVKSRLNYGRKAVKKEVESYEKKTGVRLHSITPLPLLLYFLFRQEAAAAVESAAKVLAQVWSAITGKAATTVATAGTAAAAAGAAGSASAGAAVAVGATISAKVIAGIVAAVLAVCVSVGGVILAGKASDTAKDRQESQPCETTPMAQTVCTGTMEQWQAFFGLWYDPAGTGPILELSENTLSIKDQTYSWSLDDCRYYPDEEYAGMTIYDADRIGRYALIFTKTPEGAWCANLCQLGELNADDRYDIPPEAEEYYLYRLEDLPKDANGLQECPWLDEIWGHWEPVPAFESDSPEGITIHQDGTVWINGVTTNIVDMVYYTEEDYPREKLLLVLNMEVPGMPPLSGDLLEGAIRYTRHTDGLPYLEYLLPTDDPNTYDYNAFFRPEKYDAVTLTTENLFDYVQCDAGVKYVTGVDEDGKTVTYAVQVGTQFRFKEGLGIASYVMAEANGLCVVYETALSDQGAVLHSSELSRREDVLWLNFNGASEEGEIYDHTLLSVEELPATVTWACWENRQTTYAYGVVYIPKN